MKIIGVTGGIGSGKSTVCRIFAELGAKVIDADAISRRIMDKGAPAYSEVVEFFGKEILSDNGEIDRKRLADIVFSDKAQLDKLNEITHKYIFAKMRERLEEFKNEKAVILDVPLLFSSDFTIEYDASVAVIADEKLRVERAMMRDGATAEKIRERIKNQISDAEYFRLADFVIENNEGETELLEKVSELYKKIVVE